MGREGISSPHPTPISSPAISAPAASQPRCPGWAVGCSGEPAHKLLAPFCQNHLGRSQSQAGKADAREAARMGRTRGGRKMTADIEGKSPSAKRG